MSGAVLSKEVVAVFVTADATLQGSLTVGIFDNLVSKGYIDTNGKILNEVTIPGAGYADGVAVADDGSVWVSARDDLIAKIAV